MSKDLMIRSSSAEFLIFERQTHDKGIQVRFEGGDFEYAEPEMIEVYRQIFEEYVEYLKKLCKS